MGVDLGKRQMLYVRTYVITIESFDFMFFCILAHLFNRNLLYLTFRHSKYHDCLIAGKLNCQVFYIIYYYHYYYTVFIIIYMNDP